MRLMTWNCLGMDDVNKQTQLKTYKANKSIDYIFLQEGDPRFDNPVAEGTSAGGCLLIFATDEVEKIIEAAFKKNIIPPVGGVSRKATYNLVTASTVTVLADPAYVLNEDIKNYLKAPAKSAPLMRKKDDNKKMVELQTRRGYSFTDYPSLGENVKKHILDPIQHRVNLLGHRRPKVVTVPRTSGPAITVYYWHAPLGSDTSLSSVGFSSYSDIALENSGGELAVAANILFAWFLGITGTTGVFPTNSVLIGDLNIKIQAVKKIYNTTNVLSSDDGLCHAIAGSGVTLAPVANDFAAASLGSSKMGYQCSTSGLEALKSDHAPLVFDAA